MATNCGSIGRVGSLTNGVGGNEPDGDLVSVSSSQEEVWIETKHSQTRMRQVRARVLDNRCAAAAAAAAASAVGHLHSTTALDPGLAVGSMAAAGAERPASLQPGDRRLTLLAHLRMRTGDRVRQRPAPHYGQVVHPCGLRTRDPALLLHVLTNVWRLPLPKAGAHAFTRACQKRRPGPCLLHRAHKCLRACRCKLSAQRSRRHAKFEKLEPRLRPAGFERPAQAAKTTDAWLISTGPSTRRLRLVGEVAIRGGGAGQENRVLRHSASPWGVIRRPRASSSAGAAPANDGRCRLVTAPVTAARNLERYLCSLRLASRTLSRPDGAVVATLLEGGASAFTCSRRCRRRSADRQAPALSTFCGVCAQVQRQRAKVVSQMIRSSAMCFLGPAAAVAYLRVAGGTAKASSKHLDDRDSHLSVDFAASFAPRHDKHLRRLLKRHPAQVLRAGTSHRLSLYIVGRLIQELIRGGYTHEYTRDTPILRPPIGALVRLREQGCRPGNSSRRHPISCRPSTAAATPANANVFFSGLRNVRSRLGINPGRRAAFAAEAERLPLSLLGPHDLGGAVPPLHPRLVFPSMRRRLHSQGAVRCPRFCALSPPESTRTSNLSITWSWPTGLTKYETEALAMLDHCHRFDPRRARRLVTYRLAEFGGHTCMSLAYTSRSMRFLSHACPQLSSMTFGELPVRRHSRVRPADGLRVVLLCGILAACPPAFFLLPPRQIPVVQKPRRTAATSRRLGKSSTNFAQQEGSDSGDEASEAEQAARTAAAAAAGAPAQAFVEPESLRNLMPLDACGFAGRQAEANGPPMRCRWTRVRIRVPTEAAKAAASQDAKPARQALLSAGGDCKDWSDGSMSTHASQQQQQQQKQAPVLHYHTGNPNRRCFAMYTYRDPVCKLMPHAPPQPPVMQQQQQQQRSPTLSNVCTEFFTLRITRYMAAFDVRTLSASPRFCPTLWWRAQKPAAVQEVVVFANVASLRGRQKVREWLQAAVGISKLTCTVHLSRTLECL
uniref:SET domain-containing protein n=1 Tax=Macrostomum lignano TaxID=282301 RepID=A0A1I8JQ54_9PLAT